MSEETNEDRFRRLAASRTNEILKKLDILGHCANKQNYGYSKEQVDQIFLTIEKKLNEIRIKFKPKEQEFHL